MLKIPNLTKKIHHILSNTISCKRTQMLNTQFYVFTPKEQIEQYKGSNYIENLKKKKKFIT